MIAIIPAAGKGERLKKITKGEPKELLPIKGKPMICWAIKEVEEIGIKKIVVIISEEKEKIRQVLGEKYTYLYQSKPLGVFHAIQLAKNLIDEDKFIVTLPDNVKVSGENCLPRLVEIYNTYQTSVIGLMKLKREYFRYFSNCGKVEIEKIKEKVVRITKVLPKGRNYLESEKKEIIKYFPRYILQEEFLKYGENYNYKKEEQDDVPILTEMAKDGKLLGVVIEGMMFDVGNPRGYKFVSHLRKI